MKLILWLGGRKVTEQDVKAVGGTTEDWEALERDYDYWFIRVNGEGNLYYGRKTWVHGTHIEALKQYTDYVAKYGYVPVTVPWDSDGKPTIPTPDTKPNILEVCTCTPTQMWGVNAFDCPYHNKGET